MTKRSTKKKRDKIKGIKRITGKEIEISKNKTNKIYNNNKLNKIMNKK